MYIEATFTGEDRSLNYRTGEDYILEFIIEYDRSITIKPQSVNKDPQTSTPRLCIYTSLSAFFDNWMDVNKVPRHIVTEKLRRVKSKK